MPQHPISSCGLVLHPCVTFELHPLMLEPLCVRVSRRHSPLQVWVQKHPKQCQVAAARNLAPAPAKASEGADFVVSMQKQHSDREFRSCVLHVGRLRFVFYDGRVGRLRSFSFWSLMQLPPIFSFLRVRRAQRLDACELSLHNLTNHGCIFSGAR